MLRFGGSGNSGEHMGAMALAEGEIAHFPAGVGGAIAASSATLPSSWG